MLYIKQDPCLFSFIISQNLNNCKIALLQKILRKYRYETIVDASIVFISIFLSTST